MTPRGKMDLLRLLFLHIHAHTRTRCEEKPPRMAERAGATAACLADSLAQVTHFSTPAREHVRGRLAWSSVSFQHSQQFSATEHWHTGVMFVRESLIGVGL